MDETIPPILAELDKYATTLDPDSGFYWKYHRRRFAWVGALMASLVAEFRWHKEEVNRILDIGNSYQTLIFDKLFPEIQIDTFGFLADRYAPSRPFEHYDFDLNDAFYRGRWPVPRQGSYDIISFLEVIEHLYTAPTIVLRMLGSLLKENGLIVIQTPNAVALKKRYKMLTGRNPFELIRENRMDPGHFREYTVDELCYLATLSGFEVKDIQVTNFFLDGAKIDRMFDRISNYLPRNFRSGITIVLRKTGDNASG